MSLTIIFMMLSVTTHNFTNGKKMTSKSKRFTGRDDLIPDCVPDFLLTAEQKLQRQAQKDAAVVVDVSLKTGRAFIPRSKQNKELIK